MTVKASIIVQTIDESRRVLDAMDRKEARVLARTGSYGRTTMRRKLPRRKKPSLPGNPPHAHAKGSSGLKRVLYAVTKSDASVSIGHEKHIGKPPAADSKGVRRSVRASKPVPQLLNEGGAASLQVTHPTSGTKIHSANYRRRPFRDAAYRPTLAFFAERLRRERL